MAELEERCHRLANALRALGLRHGERVAVLSPNAPADPRGALRRAARRAACSSPSTRAWRAPRSTTSSGTRARACCSSTTSSPPLVEPLALTGVDVVRCRRQRAAPTTPTSRCSPSGAPERPESLARGRGGADLDQLHVGHDRPAQGRAVYTYRGAYLNALSECIVAGLTPECAFLWTLPMFHCNGWCFTWAVTAVGARHVTDAQGRSRGASGS